MTEEEALRIARNMVMLRRMEIESDPLYVMRKIRGFLHLYDGEVRRIMHVFPCRKLVLWALTR